jgi:hypothetical protein
VVNLATDGLTKANKEIFKTTVTNLAGNTPYELRFAKITENQIDYLPPKGTKGFYSLSFDASNWYIPQTVEITAIDNNQVDDVLRDGSIKYDIVTGDPNYASLVVSDQSIGIVDRIIDTKIVEEGSNVSLNEFKDLVNDFELPVIGKLGNDSTMSTVIDTIQSAISAAVESEQIPTAKKLELAIEKFLTQLAGNKSLELNGVQIPLFGKPEVTVEMDENGVSFSINLGQKFTKEWKLPDDFGVGGGAFKVSAKGGIEASLEYDLTLTFGVNKNFGFYINTGDSGIRFAVGGGLTPDFTAGGQIGFISAKIENSLENPTEVVAEAILRFADPDNISTFKYFDVNGNGKFDGKPIVTTVPIDQNQDSKPDPDPNGKPKTKDVSIQEVFTEVNSLGEDKYALPSLNDPDPTKIAAAHKAIDWNGNKVFDEPGLIVGKGVYRTIPISATVTKATYYFDANRNNVLDADELSTTADKWIDKTDPNAVKAKEFTIVSKPKLKQTAGPASATNAPKLTTAYYFDRNGDNQYTDDEELTAAQSTKYGVGKIKGDSITSGEGTFISGRGLAYRDANNNGQLDLEPFLDNNKNGIWDPGEATISNPTGNVKPNREVFVTSAYNPIEVDTRALTTFLDVNNDGKQVSLLTTSDRPDPIILTYSRQEVEHKFLNWTGDSAFEPAYKEDENKNPVFLKDAQGNVLKDKNGDPIKEIDPAKSITADVRILENETEGEQKFAYLDLNGDSKFSSGGELLRDKNDDGVQNGNEFYLDLNNNGTWDETGVPDAIVNLKSPSLSFFDINNDGKQSWLLDKNGNGVKDGDEVETTGLILKEEIKNKQGKVTGSFLYLDTSLNSQFDPDTEFKVVDAGFGKFVDVNGDGIYNTGESVIISREGIIRKLTGAALNSFGATSIGYIDVNNDGKFDLTGIGPAYHDVLVNSANNLTSATFDGVTVTGKTIDFIDLDVDAHYSDEDLRLGWQPGKTYAYWDRNGDGQFQSTESLILNAITYLDVNQDSRLNSSSTSEDAVGAFKKLRQIWQGQNSTDIVEDAPDPQEAIVLSDGKGGQYLDLNFNGQQDPGEPFSADGEEAMTIDPRRILSFDIVRNGTVKYLDNNGDGLVSTGTGFNKDQALDEEIDISATKKSTLSALFQVGDLDRSVTFLDVDGDRYLSAKDYRVLIDGDGKQFVDIKRDGQLNTIDERDLNGDGRASITEREFEAEPFAEANNNFDALIDAVYQPAKLGMPAVHYYDLNRNGQYDKLSDALKTDVSGKLVKYFDDGESLTAFEVIKALSDKEANSLISFTAGAKATVGLRLTGGLFDDSAWPSMSGDLVLELPSPRIIYDKDGGRKELTTTTLQLKDIKLDLGSGITNVIKPIVSKIDKYIDPIKPIIKFLSKDLEIPAKLKLDSLFESDGRPGTTLLEIVDKLVSLQSTEADKKAAAAPGGSGGKLNKTQQMLRGLQSTIKFVKVVVNLQEAIETLNELTKDTNSLQLALGQIHRNSRSGSFGFQAIGTSDTHRCYSYSKN